jgi:sialate O-acetylesterase
MRLGFAVLAALITCSSGLTAALKVNLQDFQVLQRGQDGKSSYTVQVEGGSNAQISVDGKAISGSTLQLATGGPYTVQVKSGNDSVTVKDLLVGDLWLLVGQSNMEGVGNLNQQVEPPHPMVHVHSQDDSWALAKEPLHRLPDAADRVHWRLNAQKQPEKLTGVALENFIKNRKKGAGLGLAFAVAMYRRTQVPIGLLANAHGGTSMAQWDPALKEKGGDSLYGATYRRVALTGGKVAGILWYQGEADANDNAKLVYREKMRNLIASFRKEFGDEKIPFYYAQLSRHTADDPNLNWNAIQEDQRLLETEVANTAMVAGVDLSLDDQIHVSVADLKRLGLRMANVACKNMGVDSCKSYEIGPRPKSAIFDAATGLITVTYESVNGDLVSDGRLNGFDIFNGQGKRIESVYHQRAVGKTVQMSVEVNKLKEGDFFLRYGAGRNPYCNLKDSFDMAAPAFGPMKIERK